MAEDYMDELRDRDDRVRTYETEKNTWTIKAHNPYGLLKITCKGPTPALLAGAYTTHQQAQLAITKYENGKLHEPAPRKQVPKVKLTPKEA